MKVMKIDPAPLRGQLELIPSKSATHRSLICAALAQGTSQIENFIPNDDTAATLDALEKLGAARAGAEGGALSVNGGNRPVHAELPVLNCAESGSTLRFLVPVSLLFGGALFTGRGRLMLRPMEPLKKTLESKGVIWEQGEILEVSGSLQPGEYVLPGNVSSQFISGLLFALPLLAGDSVIRLTTEVQSRGYIEMTFEMQRIFGVHSRWKDENTILVPGGQKYMPSRVRPEGDWSHAAFYLAAGAMGGQVRLTGLEEKTQQSDSAMVALLRGMGAPVSFEGGALTAGPGRPLFGITADVSQSPDLVPALAVAACAARGDTRIEHAERLRGKESDRLRALREELGALGADIEERPDGLIIHGTGTLRGGRCAGRNDHRIAMALAVAACICREPVYLEDYGCVAKSAPKFWEEYRSMGGIANECELGPSL